MMRPEQYPNRKISQRFPRARTVLASAALMSLFTANALSADGTWGSDTGQPWNSPGGWLNGIVPGNNSGTLGTSVDLATFTSLGLNLATSFPLQIDVDAGRNIHSMIFEDFTLPVTASTAYRIGSPTGNPLFLSNNGAIRMLDTVTASGTSPVLVDIDAPLVLTGTSYTFDASGGSVANSLPGLRFNGNVTVASGAPTTITLTGAHGGPSSSRAELQSQFTDGAGGAILSFVKNGPGTWEMNQDSSAPNLYSGDTIINEGVLRSSTAGTFNGQGGFSPNSHYIVNSGGLLRNSVPNSTVKAMTINSGGSFNVSTAASTTLNFASESGPSIHLNYVTNGAGTFNTNGPFNLIGTVPLEGGIKLSSGSLTGHANIGATASVMDIGSVMRVFDVGKGDPNNAYDLRINGPVQGGGPGAGIIKTGPGTLRFESASVAFGGTLEIREGEVRAQVDNAFTANPHLLITGGNLHIFGGAGQNQQSFASFRITKGSTTGGSSITSTIFAPAFDLDVGAGDTATIGTVLADRFGASPLNKSGAGTASMTANNSYTGLTTISGGALIVNTNSEDVILTGPAGADITAGRLIIDYANGTSPANQIVGPILTPGFATNFAVGQIRSSTAVAGQLGLGWRDDAVAETFTIAYTRYGDANLDGITNIGDFSLLASNFNSPGGWASGDFNYDGQVNIGDFSLLASNFNQSAPAASARPGAVPEPSAISLLAVAAVGVIRRRR